MYCMTIFGYCSENRPCLMPKRSGGPVGDGVRDMTTCIILSATVFCMSVHRPRQHSRQLVQDQRNSSRPDYPLSRPCTLQPRTPSHAREKSPNETKNTMDRCRQTTVSRRTRHPAAISSPFSRSEPPTPSKVSAARRIQFQGVPNPMVKARWSCCPRFRATRVASQPLYGRIDHTW